MVTLSDNAQKALNEYLRETRAYLQGAVSVDVNEVEQSITEHIENELRDATEPVGLDALAVVLKKLGSPRQWVPEEELPEWRKFVLRLRTGPEDWRLAYLSLALLVLGFVLLPTSVVLLPASFCISRAALSAAGDKQLLGPQKWLIYPSLIVTDLTLGFLLLLGPTLASVSLADDVDIEWAGDLSVLIFIQIGIVSVTTGLWWLVLGIVSRRRLDWIRVVFAPFGEKFKPQWGRVLAWIGLFLLLLPLAAAILFLA